MVQDQNRKGLPPLQRPASSRSGGWQHKQLLLGALAIVALSLLPLMAITADTYNRVVKMYNIVVHLSGRPLPAHDWINRKCKPPPCVCRH